jgi:hypothetical protein
VLLILKFDIVDEFFSCPQLIAHTPAPGISREKTCSSIMEWGSQGPSTVQGAFPEFTVSKKYA